MRDLFSAVSRWHVRRALRLAEGERHTPATDAKPAILVVRLEGTLGDNVLFTGTFRALRESFPSHRLVLVCHPAMAAFWSQFALADRIEPYAGVTGSILSLARRVGNARAFACDRLAGERFELAVVARVDVDYDAALVALFSGAPRRVGFAEGATPRKSVANAGFDGLLTEIIRVGAPAHEVDHAQRMLAHLGARPASAEPYFPVAPEVQARADERLRALGFDFGRPTVAIAVGFGSSSLKRWPAGRFAALASALGTAQFVAVGTEAERALLDEFRGRFDGPLVDVVGRTSIEETAAILRRCHVFVGADTGCLHLATAVGTPAVGLYGASSIVRFGPRGERTTAVASAIECSPQVASNAIDRCSRCLYDENLCMHAIEVPSVITAVERFL